MLAMMACILYENPKNLKVASELMNVPVHTPYQALPPPPIVSLSACNSTIFGLLMGKLQLAKIPGTIIEIQLCWALERSPWPCLHTSLRQIHNFVDWSREYCMDRQINLEF